MEQFEEWKNQNCEDKSCPHEASCNGCENIWRAALEMVLEELDKEESFETFYRRIKDEVRDT